MFCKNCGNEIPDGANVCGYCGTPVTDAGNNQYQSPGNQYQNPGNQYQNPGMDYGAAPDNMDGGATGMAITSMVLGIIALLVCCCVKWWWLTVGLAVVSIVLGALALNRHTTGKDMAIAGIVCSGIALVLKLIVVLIGAAALSAMFTTMY
ncbi:MAG: zinc-ribbon domain-containing protein [Muribaculaceae bacterium]|nr:zinc-ribbon domain-containing protein [Roseburia sp.]MCM1430468.1 zinc-ribbon domain-containing protein [Muribaculaceae bacterium]MCM1493141.1 zinc-ribbon domain-containing protein [Muribaculaceae bacterium]